MNDNILYKNGSIHEHLKRALSTPLVSIPGYKMILATQKCPRGMEGPLLPAGPLGERLPLLPMSLFQGVGDSRVDPACMTVMWPKAGLFAQVRPNLIQLLFRMRFGILSGKGGVRILAKKKKKKDL